jgi:hypothetical protein
MPKKKVSEEEIIHQPTVFLEDTSDVDAVLEQVGATSKYIAIKRINASTKEEEYVGRYELPVENLLERVKEDHGGGKYTGRICGEGGRYLKHLTFSIDSRFRPAPVAPPPVVGVATGTPPSSELGEIRSMLKEFIAFQIQMMNSAPKHDPLEVGLRIAEAMNGRRNETPVVSSPTPPWSEMFSIFKQGMEMGATASGGEGLGYLPVIEKLGGPLVDMLGKLTAAKTNPTVLKAQNGVKEMPKPIPTNPEQYLTAYLPQLIGLAVKKKDPSFYADVVLDQVPESAHEYLIQTASRPDVVAYLTSLHSGVKEHEAWFLEFVKGIREAYEEEPALLDPEPTEIPSFEVDGNE